MAWLRALGPITATVTPFPVSSGSKLRCGARAPRQHATRRQCTAPQQQTVATACGSGCPAQPHTATTARTLFLSSTMDAEAALRATVRCAWLFSVVTGMVAYELLCAGSNSPRSMRVVNIRVCADERVRQPR